MTDVSIRPAAPSDVPAIKRIGEAAWNTVYADVLDQSTIDAALDEWYTTDALHDSIETSDVEYFVGERDGQVVGYAAGGVNELEKGELAAIYVDPDAWRNGIGTRLLQHVEAYGRDAGWTEIQIRVIAGNDIACRFYERHGYELHDTTAAPLFGEDIEELTYEKPLD